MTRTLTSGMKFTQDLARVLRQGLKKMDNDRPAVCKIPADPRGNIDTVWLKEITEKEATKYAKDYYKNLVSLVKDFLESKEYEHFEHTNARVLSTRVFRRRRGHRSFIWHDAKAQKYGQKAREYA